MNDPPEDVKGQRSERRDRWDVRTTVTLVASSSEETLMLTRRGEVLVCRHHPRPNFDSQQLLSRSGYCYDDPTSFRVSSSDDDTNAIVGKFSRSCLVGSDALCCDCEKKGLCDCGDEPNKNVMGISSVHPASKSTTTMNPLERYDSEGNLKTADAVQGNHDLVACASSEDADETLDTVEVNDLLPNQDYFCRGNGSPTPVKSFDYNGYEPPTPGPIGTHDRFVFPEGTTNHSFHGVDGNIRTDSATIQNETETSGCDISPLPAVSDDSFALPGVPIFLHLLAQIRITSLSAHPLGRHVLLISDEGLLFSYGSNDFGQLGLGNQSMKTSVSPSNGRQYHPHPTIVTPLLENGGKTINCAAGIDYSLVVVKTDGSRRKIPHQQRNRQNFNLNGKDSSCGTDECDAHHQMYGFGNNSGRKLGLLNPDRGLRRGNRTLEPYSDGTVVTASNCVFLPRRVALHCRVIHREQSSSAIPSPLPPYGIFSIAASIDNSAALVRRPSGAIECFTWGRSSSIPTKSNIDFDGDIQSRPMSQLARGGLLNEVSGETSYGPLPQSKSELESKLTRHVHSNQFMHPKN
ncbi:hypothetical protein ACHAW5_002911 [Stephanodiscus triporus]|uniref:Uncharacterized protein n=1 Tax=Stephanodiscus triporus TaxID=2934178 RepID=A0ABD3PUR3_9STRA